MDFRLVHGENDKITGTALVVATPTPPLTDRPESTRRRLMSTVRVPLTRGKFALIDASDANRVLPHKWYASMSAGFWYAARWDGTTRTNVYLHRFLMEAPPGSKVDHINHDGLDNRRENLRVCTNSQNMTNRRGPQRNNTHGYLGIYRKRNRWAAAIQVEGRTQYLGGFATAEEAARARDKAAIKYHGEFATLNFPDEQ